MTLVALMLIASTAMAAECLQIGGDRVLGRDLAASVGEFGAAPDAFIALVPAPGATRVLTSRELAAAALAAGVQTANPVDVCVQRRSTSLSEAAVLSAMRKTVGEAVDITITDLSAAPIPEGTLTFELPGLLRPPAPGEPSVWRGRVEYAPGRTVPVWAKVRLRATRPVLVARVPLRANNPVVRDHLDEVSIEWLPPADSLQSASEVAEMVPRRTIRPGEVLRRSHFVQPLAIARGDQVRVTSRSRGASITIEARAESSGREGDSILFRNLNTGKTFKAIADGRGRATAVLNEPSYDVPNTAASNAGLHAGDFRSDSTGGH
jgi:flagella basal body P-ring formation protein FlgA